MSPCRVRRCDRRTASVPDAARCAGGRLCRSDAADSRRTGAARGSTGSSQQRRCCRTLPLATATPQRSRALGLQWQWRWRPRHRSRSLLLCRHRPSSSRRRSLNCTNRGTKKGVNKQSSREGDRWRGAVTDGRLSLTVGAWACPASATDSDVTTGSGTTGWPAGHGPRERRTRCWLLLR